MSAKRKISIRKILQSIVTLVVMTGCTVAILSATKQQRKRTIKNIVVNIQNDEYGFIDKAEVEKIILKNKNIDLSKVKIETLDVLEMEESIGKNEWVKQAQVYVDNDRVLHAEVTQRVPVVRVFDKEGSSYYLDSSRKRISLSPRYVLDAMVITNVPKLTNDSVSENIKAQILKLSAFIENDSFWSAQVTQIIVDDNGGFELVPVLGKHRILIGDTNRLDRKFNQLYSFYKNVLNRIGWDKYEVLDVRYKDQLVASPSMPWNVPQDRVRTRMNWVSSITGLPAEPISIPIPVNMQPTKNTKVDSGTKVIVPPVVETQADAAPFPAREDKSVDEKTKDDNKKDEIDEQNGVVEEPKKKKVIPKYIYQGGN